VQGHDAEEVIIPCQGTRPARAGVTNSGSEAHVTHLSDPELVRRTLQGDTAAFGTLVERYKQVVYGVCVSLLGDFALAQDLAQEAFPKAFQHVHRLTMPEHFGNWLCIIARNEMTLSTSHIRTAHTAPDPRWLTVPARREAANHP